MGFRQERVELVGGDQMGVAYDAGAKLRSNAGKIDIGQVISQAAHDAVHNVASMYAPAAIAMHLGPAVHDFVTGIMGGGKSAGSPAAVAAKQVVNKQVAAPSNAGATITLPDGTKAQMPSAAFLKANPATAYGGGPVAPAAAAPAAAGSSSPLDVVRAAAMANGGLSLNQLGALTESVSRMIPPVTQKPVSVKDQILGQYQSLANDYAVRTAQDPNYANTQGGKAHAALLQQLREGAASANSIFDAMNSGMPSSDQ